MYKVFLEKKSEQSLYRCPDSIVFCALPLSLLHDAIEVLQRLDENLAHQLQLFYRPITSHDEEA
jgi:hypothetical protein